MNDFEREYWRLRAVVRELSDVVAALMGAAMGAGVWLITRDWGWPDWLIWLSAFGMFFGAAAYMKKQFELSPD